MNGNGLQESNAAELQRLGALYGNQPGYQAFADKLNAYNTALNNYNSLLASKGYNGGRMGASFWSDPEISKAYNDLGKLRSQTLGSVPNIQSNDPANPARQQFSSLVTQPEYGDRNGTGFMGGLLKSPALQPALDVVAAGTGNPELIPLINGLTTYGATGNLGKGLMSAGEAFAGTEAMGALANAYPNLGLPGGSAGNSLTDLLGMTQGAGSLTGAGTIGGDFSNLVSGIKDAAGNAVDFGGISGTPTTDAATNAARSAVSTAAAAPSSSPLTGYLPGNGGSIAGGGTAGGFVTAPGNAGTFGYDLSGNAVAPTDTGIGAGVGAAPAGPISSLFTPANTPSTGGFNYDLNGTAAGMSSYSAPDMLAAAAPASDATGLVGSSPSIAKGLGSMMSPLENTAAKAGLSYLLGKTNTGGYNALQNAGNEYAANYQPFMKTGQQATGTLADLYGLNGQQAAQAATQNWQNTPGYQFALKQGLNALDASAARRGMLMSGNQQRAVQDYGTGLANQYYNQYLNNLQQQANAGQNAAQGVGAGQVGAAEAFKEGKQPGVNNYNNMIGGLTNWLLPSSGQGNGILSYLFS